MGDRKYSHGIVWIFFALPITTTLPVWSDNYDKTLKGNKNMRKGENGRTISNLSLRNFVSTLFHCDSATRSIEWIHDSTIVEVADFVFWTRTRTIVVIYYLDVAVLHLSGFSQMHILLDSPRTRNRLRSRVWTPNPWPQPDCAWAWNEGVAEAQTPWE